jgi:hypothetical protein
MIPLALRLVIGVSLLAAGAPKMARPIVFLEVVYRYELAGPVLGWILAAVIPVAEIVIGICLIGGVAQRGACICAIILLSLFGAAQIFVLIRGMSIDCGCFTDSREIIGTATIARTSILLLAAILFFGLSSSPAHTLSPK